MQILRRPPKMNEAADYAISAADLGVRYDLRFTKKTTIRSSIAQAVGRGQVDQFWALRHVNLHVQRGESLAVIGPNGAGKSTLLHLLSGAIVPDAGEVDVRGTVRLLPQTAVRLDGERPLLEWFREQTRLPEDEARTLLAHYRLGAEAISRPVGRLSPGERARVHVAGMVAAGADLILLDEPTNHLDFDTLEVIEAALRAYRGTLVVASHDRALHEAIDCDRVIEIRDGDIVA
jgi:ATPase subunit of ABC transporter with duplicated ATPase domains